MKGDFSRITFDPRKNFTSVLMQQGRVQLDSDWNEQAGILLWQVRTLARAIIGPHGGPGDSFQVAIDQAKQTATLKKGVYFVDGIACRTDGMLSHSLPKKNEAAVAGDYFVYLDAWERVVTYLEEPDLAEPALGEGIDTTLRTRVAFDFSVETKRPDPPDPDPGPPTMTASLKEDGGQSMKPCVTSPDSGYRGAANQLYRVEIHSADAAKTRFKWSRENGSVAFPVTKVTGTTLTLGTLGRDERFTLRVGDFVEFEHGGLPWNQPQDLGKIKSINSEDKTVTVDAVPKGFTADEKTRALVRRWDHAPHVKEALFGVVDDKVIELEDGLQVSFHADPGQQYWRGDYWLIPARTASKWTPVPDKQPAHRMERGWAALASFTLSGAGKVTAFKDLRRTFDPIAKPIP